MNSTWRRVRIATVLVTWLTVPGCAFMGRAGVRPEIGALDRLVVGTSSSAEISVALGEPAGRGRSYLPFQESPREMWSYYYEEATQDDARRVFLFVYLKDGVYDGYMWFSSLPGDYQPD